MCDHYDKDGAGFKAILSRQYANFARKYDNDIIMEWLQFNADSAWENCNKYDLMQNDFCTKTADHRMWRVFDCHSAVTLLINCIE